MAWVSKKEKLAGFYMGICALIKPTYGILLLWGVLRKKKRFALSLLITMLAVVVISLPIFGLQNFIDYAHVSSYMGKHGEAFYPDQSFLTHELRTHSV
jgi:hypothetical protein